LRERNTVFNFIGSAVVALSMIVAAPFYLRLLGAEVFGLIGVSYTLIVILSIFDCGLTPTLQRELAQLSGNERHSDQMRSVVRTFELINWSICIVAAVSMTWLISAFGGARCLGANSLSPQILNTALCWMVVHAVVQILVTFYGGGLLGLQRQGTYNWIVASFALFRALASILLLFVGWIHVVGFFVFQAIVSVAQLLVVCSALWAVLPPGKASFEARRIDESRRFALGMLTVTVLSTLLTQIDKLILSSRFTLEYFGYYVLAWNIAMLIVKPAQPIYNAYLPVFSQLVRQSGKLIELTTAYHQACRRNAVLIWPLALLLCISSYPILWIYSGSETVARQAWLALSLLAIGAALNATMLIPYALTQAYGWVSFSVVQNMVACLIMLPFCYWASVDLSLTKAAMGWFVVNLGYATISIYFLHRRLLPDRMAFWYLEDHRLRYLLPQKWVRSILSMRNSR
jgi:O-antigen/teichoic acid export membrane protein